MAEIHIHDDNFEQFTDPTVLVDGEHKAKGLIPRNYETHPQGFYARETAFDFPLVPESEWDERITEMEESESRLSDIRMTGMYGKPIPALDQNGRGYCWRHSPTSAVLLIRARDNQPYLDLSPYAGACRIKHYRDEGGWGAQGLDDCIENGDPTSKFWPQRSVDPSNDTPEMRANAKLHRVSESWADMNVAQYDRKLTFAQVVTCLLLRMPVIGDFNWWGHSVCLMDAVSGKSQRKKSRGDRGKLLSLKLFEAIWAMNDPVMRGIAIRILNSWGDGWSEMGSGILSGQKAVPDSATCARVVNAAAA